MKENCDHIWKRIDRTPEITGMNISYHYSQCELCNMVVYPLDQLQLLIDYSKDNQFMFAIDWVLALFYAMPDAPIVGSTSLQKQVFLMLKEFAPRENIPTENIGFKAYNFGPYAARIDNIINVVLDEGAVETYGGRANSNNEHFQLTENGRSMAKKAFDKLTADQQDRLIHERKRYQQLGTEGLTRYVYTHYQKYTSESKIKNRILRIGKNKKMVV
jgi:hypothetical protein